MSEQTNPAVVFIIPTVGAALLIGGTELWLHVVRSGNSGPIGALAMIGAGIVCLGLVRQAERGSGRAILVRLAGGAAFSAYLTWTAFSRFRGLAKDIEPTLVNEILYFAKWLLVVAGLVGVVTVTQIVAKRIASRLAVGANGEKAKAHLLQ